MVHGGGRGLSREALSHRGAAHFGKVIEKHRDHLDLMAVRIVYRMIQTRADHVPVLLVLTENSESAAKGRV
jgi:hypothetical protein